MAIILNGTNGETFPSWTTATRPASPTAGQTGYNTTTSALDIYNGSAWTTAISSTSGGAAFSNITLNGSSSGSTVFQSSATASGTVTLPAGTGTAAIQGVSTNLVAGTAVPFTSTTTMPVTGIPAWVRRITVMFNGVTTSSTSNMIVQLGTGATPTYTTSGYTGGVQNQNAGTQTAYSTGFMINNNNNGLGNNGVIVFNYFGSNTWVGNSMLSNSNALRWGAGLVTLAAPLTALQLTTVSTDTFTAGSLNYLYE